MTTDIHNGVYKYKTLDLESLVPPTNVGDLIAIKSGHGKRVTFYVADVVDGQRVWTTIAEHPERSTP